jgi:glycosyltransferase involved in cell wall biosynthesis
MVEIAVISVRPKTGEVGGAERLVEGLAGAIRARGHLVDLVYVESDESSFETIEETYLRCYDLDLARYEGVISTKAPSYLVRHPNHVCYLIHTIRAFYDMFDGEFPQADKRLLKQRDLIHSLDTGALRPPRTKKVFCIGHEVSRRLTKWNHIASEVIHPALSLNSFERGDFKYVFCPGRLHRWKRTDLVIDAFQHVRGDVQLLIAGTGEDEERLRARGARDPRIRFLGRVSDAELVKAYSDALVVPFVPIREDYGYVTLEAFRSGKPVITCKDSGEPTVFVCDGSTGFVCAPKAKAIGEKIEFFRKNWEVAREMGDRGRRSVAHINWPNVAQTLLEALELE